MPRSSAKENIITALVEEVAQEIVLNEEMLDDDDACENVLDEFEENINIAMSCRRGIFDRVSVSSTWRNNVLTNLDDNRFKQMLRVSREQFAALVSIIKNAKEFNGAHSCKQYSVELQLAVVLYRLGSSGESAAYRKIGSIFGIGDGGTISAFKSRIFNILLSLKSKYIYWPNETERNEIVFDTLDELPFCIRYIDGTEIKLAEAPIVDPVQYFSRSRHYSLKAQVVCDHKLRIRHVVVGHPGSWHDARIYRHSSLFKKRNDYFSTQQWIAGDSAYPLSTTLITPYRNNAKQLDRNARIEFNLRHSRYRVRVEHCFGLLKERFGSLKELRMRLANKESHQKCCEWFVVCCILHNISIFVADETFLENSCVENTVEEESPGAQEIDANIDGEIKRQVIFSLIKK